MFTYLSLPRADWPFPRRWRPSLPQDWTRSAQCSPETERRPLELEQLHLKIKTAAIHLKYVCVKPDLNLIEEVGTRLTDLHIGHPVLVFMHSQVRLRHWKQNKDLKTQLMLELIKLLNKMWFPEGQNVEVGEQTHRPAGLWFYPGRFQNKKPAERTRIFRGWSLLTENLIIFYLLLLL